MSESSRLRRALSIRDKGSSLLHACTRLQNFGFVSAKGTRHLWLLDMAAVQDSQSSAAFFLRNMPELLRSAWIGAGRRVGVGASQGLIICNLEVKS